MATEKVLTLSDTKSYRHLLAVFQALISAALADEVDHDNYLNHYADIFLDASAEMPAYVGLTWLHVELGALGLARSKGFAEDARLAPFFLVYVMILADEQGRGGAIENFHGFLYEGWSRLAEPDRCSVHHHLLHVLNEIAYSEMLWIATGLGRRKVDIDDEISFLKRKSGAEKDRHRSRQIKRSGSNIKNSLKGTARRAR